MMQQRRSCQAIHMLCEKGTQHRVSSGLVTDLRLMCVNSRRIIQPFVSASAAGIDWLKSLLYMMAMVVSLNCTNAFGSYITMETGFSVTVKPEGLALVVMAENRGDVPAHEVQFEVSVNDKVYLGPLVKTLGVAEKTSVDFSLADVFGTPGRYPIVIRTYYKDENAYPFSALTVGFYDYKSSMLPTVSISGQASRLPVDSKGQLNFVLHNDGSTAQKVDLALFIPDELLASPEFSTTEIGPQQEQSLVYELENYSALANSQYQVSLVGRYEDAGNHVGVAGSAVVSVVGDAESAVRPIWIWIVMGGLIPGVLVLLRFQKHRLGSGE
jgi:hypothetical protein